MEIKDNGFVLSLQRSQEASGIVKIFSEKHGVCRGFVKNIASKANSNLFFPGNLVEFTWSARLSEQVGTIRAELVKAFSSILMLNYVTLLSVSSIFSLIEILFREREPVGEMYDRISLYLEDIIKDGFNFRKYIEFEFFLLAKAGYSLDFTKCAVTGQEYDLKFLSPKSGRAVSSEAAKPYQDKLLKLPSFLADSQTNDISPEDMIDALKISSYFFERYIFSHVHNKDILKHRENFILYLTSRYKS
jgi:DNA repair protein RecO (recombination protein O)